MAAGLLLGPSVFGAIAPGAASWLFPAASLNLLNAFSQFGLVLFMLLVGLRLDAGHLRSNGRAVVAASYLSMALPFAMGAAYAWALSDRFGVAPAQRVAFIGFIGLSLSITAFPVLVRMLAEHGLAGTRLGTIATACAAVGDVAAWVALAFLTSIAHSGGASLGPALVGLVVYGAVMLLAVRPLLRRLIRACGPDEGMAILLTAALASAAATELLGIHALFGSFFVGVLLSKDVKETSRYVERIEPLTITLLLPLFFAYTGLRTNVFSLTAPGLVLDGVLLLTLAIAGKAMGPLLVSGRLGFSRKETLGLAALLNTRGLVELVVLNIGLEAGLLPPPLFTILVIMALVTTAMTSPLLTWLGFRRPTGALEPSPPALAGPSPLPDHHSR